MEKSLTDAEPSTQSDPREQLEAIHAMLSAGHRCIRMERHTFVIWGITGALCFFANPYLVPLVTARATGPLLPALADLGFSATGITAAAVLDYRATRRLRKRQGESLPYLQRQIGKVWLLLAAAGLLGTFGMHFHGGGAMVYTFWLVIGGIGLFTHGLFSEQCLEWAGALIIALGVGALALQVPHRGAQWLTIVICGVGLPALGFLLRPMERRSVPLRVAMLLGWLLLVVPAAFTANRLARAYIGPMTPRATAISLADFDRQRGRPREQVVALPRGTVVPIRITLEGGDMFDKSTAAVPVALKKGLELVLVDGKLDGRFRVEGQSWSSIFTDDLEVPGQRLVATLEPGDDFAVQYWARLIAGR